MRKKGLLTVAFLLFLSMGLLARAPGYPSGKMERPDQPERPKFYAVRVVSEKEVLNAKGSLGAPDGGYTEILPGGQLVVIMEKNFIESGTVVCKGEEGYALEGFFHMQDTQDERQNYLWMSIQRESSNRFTFFSSGGYFYAWWGNTGMNMVRITNIGTKSLFLDAVIGYGLEAERR